MYLKIMDNLSNHYKLLPIKNKRIIDINIYNITDSKQGRLINAFYRAP